MSTSTSSGSFLEGQQDAVAAALLALEGVVPHGTGAGPADVVALCRGTEHVFVTCVVGTPAQVHILKVGKEVFVKGPDGEYALYGYDPLDRLASQGARQVAAPTEKEQATSSE